MDFLKSLLLFRTFDLTHPLNPPLMIVLHRRLLPTHRLQTPFLQKLNPLAPHSSAIARLPTCHNTLNTTHRNPRTLPPNRTPTIPAKETREPIPLVRVLRIRPRRPGLQHQGGGGDQEIHAIGAAADFAAVGAVAEGFGVEGAVIDYADRAADWWVVSGWRGDGGGGKNRLGRGLKGSEGG